MSTVKSINNSSSIIQHADASALERSSELALIDDELQFENQHKLIQDEFGKLQSRRQLIRERQEVLRESKHSIESRFTALRLEKAALEAEEAVLADEQRSVDQLEENLIQKRSVLDRAALERRAIKAAIHEEAQCLVNEAKDSNPFNALNEALRIGVSLRVLQAIIELYIDGIDCQNTSYNSWTPLHYAAWHGHTALCELLVRSGATVNALDTYSQYTPLDWALSRHHSDAARYLTAVGGRRGAAVVKDTRRGI